MKETQNHGTYSVMYTILVLSQSLVRELKGRRVSRTKFSYGKIKPFNLIKANTMATA